MRPAIEFRHPGMKILLRSQTKLWRQVHQSQIMPPAPIAQQKPATQRRLACLTELTRARAAAESCTRSSELRLSIEVKVPGKITKPAKRIPVISLC